MSRRKPESTSRNTNGRKVAPAKKRRHDTRGQRSSPTAHPAQPASQRPKKRVSKKLIRLGVAAVFTGSSFIIGGAWVAHTSFLRVQHASVVGAQHEDAQSILRRSGLLAHPTMLGLTDHSVFANLGPFPWVTAVQVERHWPNTVIMRIFETHAVAVAYDSHGKLRYVGTQGQNLGPAPLTANLPTVALVAPTKSWPFQRNGLGAVTVAQAVPASFGSQISYISEQANGIIRLRLTTPVTFILGPAIDLEKKFVAIASVISNYTLSPGEVIDVTVPGEIAVTPAKG